MIRTEIHGISLFAGSLLANESLSSWRAIARRPSLFPQMVHECNRLVRAGIRPSEEYRPRSLEDQTDHPRTIHSGASFRRRIDVRRSSAAVDERQSGSCFTKSSWGEPPGHELIEELLVAVHCLCGPHRPEIVLEARRLSQAHDYGLANLPASTQNRAVSLNWEFQDVPFRIRHDCGTRREAFGRA